MILFLVGFVGFLLFVSLFAAGHFLMFLPLWAQIVLMSLATVMPFVFFLRRFKIFRRLRQSSLFAFSLGWTFLTFFLSLWLLASDGLLFFYGLLGGQAAQSDLPAFLYGGGFVFVGLLAAAGYQNYRKTKIVEAAFDWPMAAPARSYRLAFVSDCHFNKGFNGSTEPLGEKLKALNPDVIILGGDILDTPEFEKLDLRPLQALRPPLGFFAVEGNHEIISLEMGRKTSQDLKDFFSAYGIRLLQDEATLIDGRFWLVGRQDRGSRFLSRRGARKDLETLMAPLKADGRPIVLADHQPNELREAFDYAHLQLYGHTHNGQVWPGRWLLPYFLRFTYGFYTHEAFEGRTAYVSSGFGGWGLPLRLGTQSEIVLFHLRPAAA